MKKHLMMTVAALALAPTLAFAEAPVVAPGASGQMAPAANAGNMTAKGAASDSTAAQLATPAYVEKAAQGDMFEVESSKLALEKSKSADVKDFAKMMISAHTKTTRELTAAVKAEKLDVAIPAKLDAEHEAELAKLKSLSGAEFDKAYLDAQVKGHQAALEVHQSYAASGDNAKLKLWAGKTAKTVQMHLTKAESLDKAAGKS